MADDLSAILDEILNVKSNLRVLPADAFSERIELRVRLVELQAAVADAAHEPATREALRRRLEQLEQRRDALMDRRVDPSWQDGSLGGTGISAEQTAEINRRIDQAADRPALDAEIASVRRRLMLYGRD